MDRIVSDRGLSRAGQVGVYLDEDACGPLGPRESEIAAEFDWFVYNFGSSGPHSRARLG